MTLVITDDKIFWISSLQIKSHNTKKFKKLSSSYCTQACHFWFLYKKILHDNFLGTKKWWKMFFCHIWLKIKTLENFFKKLKIFTFCSIFEFSMSNIFVTFFFVKKTFFLNYKFAFVFSKTFSSLYLKKCKISETS